MAAMEMELEEGEFRYDAEDRMSVVGQSWEESVTTFAGNLNMNKFIEKVAPSSINGQDPARCSSKDVMQKKKKKSLTCGVCGSEFSTYQALGGHRASHNKRKIVIHDEGGKRTINVSVDRSCKGTKITAGKSDAGAGTAAAKRPKKCDGSTAVVDAVASRPRGLNIDLNLPPPPEE